MNLKDKVKKIINKYGEKVSVSVGENTYQSYAYIQSSKASGKKFENADFLSSGYKSGDKFLYIGSDDVRLDTFPINTIITAESGNYVLKEASQALLKGKTLYIWASLEKQIA